jgi:hypothetical protein
MEPEQRAEIEERIAAVEEATEQRMHQAAHLLKDSEKVHRRADKITERARGHLRRARRLRREGRAESP